MADKVVLEAEVKSNIKAVSKETKELTNDFGAFGVTIGSIKGKFQEVGKIMKNGLIQIKLQAQLAGVGLKQMFSGQILKGAKNLFTAIKVGVAATGIGALLIAFTALATFFTKTKKGAELLEKAFAGVGAAVNVIVDRVSKFGGAIVKLFEGDAKGALLDVKGAFTGIGDEIAKDTKRAIELKNAFQKLRDSQRDLNVETAEQRAEIEKLKLIAEDVTKSTAVRLKAAEDAFAKENKLLDKRITNAKEDLKLQREGMELRKVDGKNTAEDLDREAELRINLADIIGESSGKQIELNNKINAITAEGDAKRLEALNKLKEADAERMGTLTEMPEIVTEVNDQLMQADNSVLENDLKNKETQKKNEKIVLNAKKGMALQGLALIRATVDEGSTIGKAAAIADVTQSGVKAVQNAFTTALDSPITKLLPAYPFIQAGLAGAFSALQLKSIMSGTPASGGGGGGGGGAVAPATPAPQLMSGAFELGGGVAPEPVKAFVVTDEMSNSQNQLANIRRRATI